METQKENVKEILKRVPENISIYFASAKANKRVFKQAIK
jgi:hypothetical protein